VWNKINFGLFISSNSIDKNVKIDRSDVVTRFEPYPRLCVWFNDHLSFYLSTRKNTILDLRFTVFIFMGNTNLYLKTQVNESKI